MIRRQFFRLLLLFPLLGLAGLPVAPPSAGKLPQNPARIVAVGDLHGDFDIWLAIARAAGLVNAAGHWSGGRTTLVQTGDIVDRAPDSLKIIRHLMQLEREAARAGGKVVVLVGNHEAMMMTGDLRYTVPGEFAAFADARSARRRDDFYATHVAAIEVFYRRRDATLSPAAIREKWIQETPLGMIEHQAAWSPSGAIGRWTIGHAAVVQIGDTLFVHGGISPAFAAVPTEEINRRVAAALTARETAATSIINDPLGPLWYRGLAGLAPEGTAPAAPRPPVRVELDRLLALRGLQRIVIGHTPLLSGVAVLEDGHLARIDSGDSRAYAGHPGYLEIIAGRAVARPVARPATDRGK
ncbi:MAG: metallophosphoesterase [Sphingomicrobium sp.]